MNTALETVCERTVRGLLQTYPTPFRERFGCEMLQVYRSLACQTVQEAGASGLLRLWLRVVWDSIFGALVQWEQQLTTRRRVIMNLNPLDASDGIAPLAPRQAVLAVLPFLFFGLANIAMELGIGQAYADSKSLGMMLVTHPYLLFNWLILLGLAGGILCGFPRWTFSYLGWALLGAIWWANLSSYGQPVNWLWLPLAAVVIVPLLLRRLLRPARVIMPKLWRDLTLLPLGIYILYTSLYMIFDENHHPALLFFMAASALAAALGAWGFFRTASPLRRVLALTGGLALVVTLGLWSELTWDFAAYYHLPPSSPLPSILAAVIFWAVMAAVMLGLGWLAERLGRRKAA